MLKDFTIATHRRAVQFMSLLLLHTSWGPEFKWLCNPVLSCHSCVLAWFACPIGVFVHYAGYRIFPFLAIGTVLLLGVLIGRLLCGWICPFGFLQDLLYKLPGPKFTLPAWTANIKYVVLVLMVFLLPFLLTEQTAYSFCRICPASAIQVTLPNMLGGGFGGFDLATAIKLSVLLLVVVAVVVSSRSFCKTMCPIGAMLAPLNFISLWKVRVPTQNCVGCGKCETTCPQDDTPAGRIKRDVPPNRSLDCIVCHECQTICPQPKPRKQAGASPSDETGQPASA